MIEPPDLPNPLARLAAAGLEKGRLEALTDGILAVAMTLLVLDLKFDGTENIVTDQHLVTHLFAIERTFLVYIVSFVVLGMYWIAHHLQFHFVRRVDRGVLWINLSFMLLVTLVPFTTNLMMNYEELTVPVVLFGVNQLLLSWCLLINVNYVARRPELREDLLTPEVVRFLHRRLLVFSLVPMLSIAVAFVNTRAALYLYALMFFVHVFPFALDRTISTGRRPPKP